jgi:DHA1 family bicyclomycin/chloramphenicol resistance-like MFS transporter
MNNSLKSQFLDKKTPPHISTLILLSGIGALSMNMFLPSLPQMTIDLETEYSVMQLSVSMYLGFTAITQFFIGPISDKYGRRTCTLIGVAIFVLASVGCYFSQNIETFLLFRMIQATVAIGMVLSRAIIRDTVAQNKSASMIGYVTMGMALVPMFAPALGGIIDTYFGWRANFGFMAVFGLFFWILLWFDQGETNSSKGQSFLTQVKQYPELFSARRFWGYALAAAFASGTFFAFLGGAPYVATVIYKLPPTMTGLLFGIPAVGYLLGNLITGLYSTRFGINKLIIIGTFVLFIGMLLSLVITTALLDGPIVFFGFCMFVGFGNGLVLPNAQAGMLSVRPKLAGTASGIGGAIMIGGGAALAGLAGILLERGNSSQPLQIIMLISSIFSLLSIYYVIKREKIILQN